MWWLLLNVSLGIWAVIDAKKRQEKSMLFPGLSFFAAPIFLPAYIAGRNLKEGEVRKGGKAWNILKNIALFWTIMYAAFGISSLFPAVGTGTAGELQYAGAVTGADLDMVFIVGQWFCGTIGVLLVGTFLKKSAVVENGPTGTLAGHTDTDNDLPGFASEVINVTKKRIKNKIVFVIK